MIDVNFVPINPHQSGKFAHLRAPWAGHDLARKALGLGSPSTRITSPSPEDRLRCWQQGNPIANLWRNTNHAALSRGVVLTYIPSISTKNGNSQIIQVHWMSCCWSFSMTDFNFVPTKSHQPDKFALQRVPWAGHDLARKALSLVSPSTRITSPPPEDRSRCWQQRNYSANCWRNATHGALAPRAPFHFATQLVGRRTSLYSFRSTFLRGTNLLH